MANKSKLHEMKITPAEGGVHVETVHSTHRGGQGGGPTVDYEPMHSVHPSMESLNDHMAKHLKGVFPKGANEIEKADSAEEYPED
jgi:hypothetical protein